MILRPGMVFPRTNGAVPQSAYATAKPPDPRVLSVGHADFRKDHLLALTKKQVRAVRITNVLPPETCRAMARQMQEADCNPDGVVKSLGTSLGRHHFNVARGADSTDDYFLIGDWLAPRLRRLATPYPCPFERMVGVLLQGWPAGVARHRIDGHGFMCPALGRFYGEPQSQAAPPALEAFSLLPHQDDLRDEAPGNPLADFEDQLGVNLYLATPEAGGELLLWDSEFPAEAYERLRLRDPSMDYALDPRHPEVGAPSVVIRPAVGEMILIRSRALHAVAARRGPGARATFSCFAGFSPDKPIAIWA